MDDLEGRVAVIFGAGSGIGAATARAFAGAGIHVVVADIDADRALAVVDELETIGVEGLACQCDVTRAENLEAVRDAALERFGRVDIVMNNVSVIAAGAFTDIPWSEWERAIDVNLLAYVRSLQIFVPLLIEWGDGHIVNTASTAGLYPYTADRLPYVATKSAIVGLSEALALDLVPRGVGITCLCPGPVATNIFEQMRFYGDATRVRPPALPILDPEVVGEMVLGAVRAGTFLLVTHPEVHDILVRRATDPEGFLAEQIRSMQDS